VRAPAGVAIAKLASAVMAMAVDQRLRIITCGGGHGGAECRRRL